MSQRKSPRLVQLLDEGRAIAILTEDQAFEATKMCKPELTREEYDKVRSEMRASNG